MSAFEAFEGFGDSIERLTQHWQQGFTLTGQQQPAWQALEQCHVEHGFQAFDLMTHCSWRHEQLHRSAGETQMTRGRLESTQCIQRQVRTNHANSIIFLMANPRYLRLLALGRPPKLARQFASPICKNAWSVAGYHHHNS
ncbi:hypothetical protein D3C80_1537750 [compost metagenome]